MEELSVNIEEIMKEIREEAKKIPHDQVPEFEEVTDLTTTTMKEEADFLKTHAFVPYFTEVGTGIKGIIKRIIRKTIKFLILPMSESQNIFNKHAAYGMDAVKMIVEKQQMQIQRLQEEVRKLQEQLAENKDIP